MSAIITKLNEGGPFFTYPMVLMLAVILALFIKELIKGDDNKKTISLLASFGWFTLAWGFLGHTIGLITAFDSVGEHGEIAMKYVAEGLKIALINFMGGAILLLVARASIIVLIWLQKKDQAL